MAVLFAILAFVGFPAGYFFGWRHGVRQVVDEIAEIEREFGDENKEGRAMDELTDARRVLVHYFYTLFEASGLDWDHDNLVEVESIVDDIYGAAVREVERRLKT
jgi:hypothetical protein